jgi:hypothetical protein
MFLCTVHISDVPSGKRSVSVQSTHLWLPGESVLFLCTVQFLLYRGECVLFLMKTWNVFCFCAQYTILMYHLERVLFLYAVYISGYSVGNILFPFTVLISDVPWWKFSVSVHITQFWCNTWNVFSLCAQYAFLMYLMEGVLFLCTVYIPDAQWCNSLSNLVLCTDANVFVLLALLCCYFTVEKAVAITVETCKRSSFPCESDR